LSSATNVREQVVAEEANGPATLFWMDRIADLSGVDVFHNTFNILPYRMKIPTVITLTDVMWIKHPTWARGPGAWGHVEVAFYRRGMWNAIKKADRLVAISEATKQEIGSLDRSALSRTCVALEGIAEDYHAMDGAEGERLIEGIKRRYLQGAKRYVLTVGQYSVYKNHDRVLEAFARAFRDEPDMHLAFVQRLGQGPKMLRPRAKELGIDNRVHFLHGLPLIDIVALFNGATTLCHPSLYEGFGNPPAEAMACGCPVITSNRSSMPEVSGVAAELVDPESVGSIAQALKKVAGDESLRKSMHERGLERAKQLTWKAHVEGNLAAYREVLDQNRR
jgi:glycosyltransferase involved in cell wall biosynthesis